ncbi:uncharacterized protein KY384_008755 [Bacidia gigantensis]|uniref:uncharacterized protein n=1 Tax=Bacidia gigantensis TaxID=2732470 RepID=UPI001D03E31E|nr:uncharacterized protein KY384_008755 [Bacidia gigantensis]KAG8526554.1 hypothetical protein KY384_008755 [Bacidia gigantensis]
MEVDDSEQEYDEEVLFADDEASEANSEQTEHSKSDQQQSQSHRFGGSRSEQAPAELLRRFSHPQHSSQHPTSGPTRPPVQARPPTLHYPFDPHRTDPTGFSQYETPYAPSAASHTYGTTGTTQPAMLPGMLDPNDPSMMRGFNPTRTQLENPYATIQTVHGRPQQQYAGTRDAHFASSQQANRYGTLQSIPETPWQTDTTGRDASSQPGRIPTREPSNELAKVPPHAILKSNDPDDPYCKFCEKRIASTHWQSHIQSPQHIGNFERARQTTGFGERSLGPTGPTQRGKWCELCGVEILSKNWTQHKNSLTHLGKVRPGVPATPEPDPDPPRGNTGDVKPVRQISRPLTGSSILHRKSIKILQLTGSKLPVSKN